MKKLLSILLSAVMIFAVGAMSVTAFGATVASITELPEDVTVVVKVNGKTSKNVKFVKDKDNGSVVTITYNGDGKFVRWDFGNLVEGRDYNVITGNNTSKEIVVQFINSELTGELVVNAVVEGETDSSSATPNKGKSPGTGAVAAAGVVAMGAGAAILAASRRKRDAE